MAEVIAALAPVFLLIALGYGVRASALVGAEAFAAVNRFGYFILYPAFLFLTVAHADVGLGDAGAFLGGVISGFVAMGAIAFATLAFFHRDGPGFSSVFQGAIRWNGFALIAAAPALYGPQGVSYIGLAFGPLVLINNIFSVAVLARWGDNRIDSKREMARQIFANPLILACGAGMIARALNFAPSGVFDATLKLLAPAAMPIALVCVGAGLDFRAARAGGAKLATATALKLAAAPLVLWGAATLWGAPPEAAAIAAGLGATPTAAAAYTLAREMGGDAPLMAAIVSATTLASFITMPAAILLLSP
jgi:hypothetical protein